MVAAIQADPRLGDDGLDELVEKHLPQPRRPAPDETDETVHWIKVQGVRSFGPAQTLRLSGGLTIVYAANGTGKTSLVDAIELFNDGVTTRARAHPVTSGEVKDEHHVPHHDRSGSTKNSLPPQVTVAWKSGTAGDVTTSTWDGGFGEGCAERPEIQVLPRRRLRELVNAKTSERAERLGPALGLADFGDRCAEVAKGLKQFAETEDPPGNEWDRAAAIMDEAISGDLSHDGLRRAVKDWREAQATDEADVSTLELMPPPSVPASQSWADLAGDMAEHERDRPQGIGSISDGLRHLLRAFTMVADADETCPACAAGTVTQQRLAEVRAVLSGLDDMTSYDARTRALGKRYEELGNTLQAFDSTWHIDLPPVSEDADPYAALRAVVTRWRTAADTLAHARSGLAAEPDPSAVGNVEAALRDLDGVVADAQQAYRDAVDPQTAAQSDDGADRRIRDAVRFIDQDLGRVTTCLETLRRARSSRECAGRLAEQVRRHARGVIEEALDDLVRPINDWLDLLAPDDTPSIRLATRGTRGRDGVSLRVHGRGSSTHALGHFSDSQIDMLGMAAHLSRIERDHSGALIVIDDPSDMLDSHTRKRFAQQGIGRLLGDDDADSICQVVVLTHDDALVRDLWDHHRTRVPCTVQDTIEVGGGGDDRHALLTSRTASAALERAWELIKDYSDDRDRLWVRAAVAGHTRTAVEMYAKDLATLLGPAGADLLDSIPEKSNLESIRNSVIGKLKGVATHWCDGDRHTQARGTVDRARDILHKWIGDALHPGSHADVVLPEVDDCKSVLKRLDGLVELLDVPDGVLRSDWTTKSEMAEMLKCCEHCGASR